MMRDLELLEKSVRMIVIDQGFLDKTDILHSTKTYNGYANTFLYHIDMLKFFFLQKEDMNISVSCEEMADLFSKLRNFFMTIADDICKIMDLYNIFYEDNKHSLINFYKKCHFIFSKKDFHKRDDSLLMKEFETTAKAITDEKNISDRIMLMNVTEKYVMHSYNFYQGIVSFYESIIQDRKDLYSLTMRDVIFSARILEDFFENLELNFRFFPLYISPRPDKNYDFESQKRRYEEYKNSRNVS